MRNRLGCVPIFLLGGMGISKGFPVPMIQSDAIDDSHEVKYVVKVRLNMKKFFTLFLLSLQVSFLTNSYSNYNFSCNFLVTPQYNWDLGSGSAVLPTATSDWDISFATFLHAAQALPVPCSSFYPSFPSLPRVFQGSGRGGSFGRKMSGSGP